MKKLLITIVLVLMAAMAARAEEQSLKVMTFNIRTMVLTDGPDFWSFRVDQVAGLIKRHDPDLLGMQEVYTMQARDLEARLPAYAWFGPPRDDGKRHGERCPIFYKKGRFDLLDHGTFWLSETPDTPGSISWDSACKRLVTWGRFRDRPSGKVFYYFNTHFDHMGKTARAESAKLVAKRIPAIAGDAPVIFGGDFNTTDDTAPYRTITSFLEDSRLVTASPPEGPEATSRDFTPGTPPKKRIDYIFVSDSVKVMTYAALDDTYGHDRRPSDHLPVLVRVELP